MGAAVSKHLPKLPHPIMLQKSSMQAQAPIDIIDSDNDQVVNLSSSETSLTFGTAPAEIELVHHGENFQVNWSDHEQNVLLLNGKKYYTVQFHFHAPSEHTVNGEARAMELHLVHQSEDGHLAVVGVFFKEGSESKFLAQFWDELNKLDVKTNDRVDVGTISGGEELNSLLQGKIFRYTGSLTTPPYTEGVEWIVVRDVLEASSEQLEIYRKFLPAPNAREAQPLNGRSVALCQCSHGTPIGA